MMNLESVLLTRITACLKMSEGTMMITMVVQSEEEKAFCEEAIKRRKHCAMIDFEVK